MFWSSAFDPEFEDHLGLVDNARNHTLLATKLAELGHHERDDQICQGGSARRLGSQTRRRRPPVSAAPKGNASDNR
jgi:hypothetical protein